MFSKKRLFVSLLMAFGLFLSVANATVPTAPGSYVGVTKLDESNTSVRISTRDNSDNEDEFYLYIYPRDLIQPAVFPPINGQIIEMNASNGDYVYANVKGLTCNETYEFFILAKNADGYSSPSLRGSFNMETTFNATCPEVTTLLAPGPYIGVTDINETAVRISFLDHSDNEDGFRVYDDEGTIDVNISSNDETNHAYVYTNLTGLSCNKSYKLNVVAYKDGIESKASDSRPFNIHTSFDTPCSEPCISLSDLKIKIANNEDVSEVNTGCITDMSNLFSENLSFNQDISGWDVSNVTDMSLMFWRAESFNQNIASWDVSNVITMSGMFGGAESFNQNIGSWDVSSVENMNGMFINTRTFNQPIGLWDVSNVTKMGAMFADSSVFNQNIALWDVSSVTDMSAMFDSATSFNQDVSTWDVSSVTNMSGMFSVTPAFSYHDLSNWDVSKVTKHTDFFIASGVGNIEPIWLY
jgi:surface protein